MKYVDYPENLPNILVEKLNKEYSNKKTFSQNLNNQVTKQSNFSTLQTDENPIPLPTENDLNNLTDSQIQSLAQTSASQFSNIIYLLTKLNNYYNNSADKTVINDIIISLNQQKNSLVSTFNVISENFTINNENLTRKCIKYKISNEFFELLSNLLELYNLSPNNYGLYAINKNTLYDFYKFYNLPSV